MTMTSLIHCVLMYSPGDIHSQRSPPGDIPLRDHPYSRIGSGVRVSASFLKLSLGESRGIYRRGGISLIINPLLV